MPAAVLLSPQVLREPSEALRHHGQPQYKQRFSVRMRTGLYLLLVDDIAYVQADEGVTFAVDAAGARYSLTGSLAELER